MGNYNQNVDVNRKKQMCDLHLILIALGINECKTVEKKINLLG
jgi:hypothetical protein